MVIDCVRDRVRAVPDGRRPPFRRPPVARAGANEPAGWHSHGSWRGDPSSMPPPPVADAYGSTAAFPGTRGPGEETGRPLQVITGLGVTAGFHRALARAAY